MKWDHPFFASLLLITLTVACHQGGAADGPSSHDRAEPARRASPQGGPSEGREGASEGVTYVPAYPADVSNEGLDSVDVAQQESLSHGEPGHDHGEDDHDHGEDDHGHGEGDHGHGEDGHDQDAGGRDHDHEGDSHDR
ncbi:MAG: hypothetical protein MI919_31570 [Holophagales bacterium]|nr:hypothetical protein [Holophagales bacterium]